MRIRQDSPTYRQQMNQEAVKLKGKLNQVTGFFFERGAEKLHFETLAEFEVWVNQKNQEGEK